MAIFSSLMWSHHHCVITVAWLPVYPREAFLHHGYGLEKPEEEMWRWSNLATQNQRTCLRKFCCNLQPFTMVISLRSWALKTRQKVAMKKSIWGKLNCKTKLKTAVFCVHGYVLEKMSSQKWWRGQDMWNRRRWSILNENTTVNWSYTEWKSNIRRKNKGMRGKRRLNWLLMIFKRHRGSNCRKTISREKKRLTS